MSSYGHPFDHHRSRSVGGASIGSSHAEPDPRTGWSVRDRARAGFDIASLKLPRNTYIRAALNELKRTFSLGPGAYPYSMHNAAAFLAAYGHEGRLRDGAVALGEVDPATWNIVYEPIRQLTHVAYHFANRTGDTNGATRLEPLLFRDGDFYELVRDRDLGSETPTDTPLVGDRPSDELMRGGWLTSPFENRASYSIPEPYSTTQRPAEDRMAIEAAGDLVTASTMWVWGGSEEWPRERIDAYVDDLIAQWHALDGWAPGW